MPEVYRVKVTVLSAGWFDKKTENFAVFLVSPAMDVPAVMIFWQPPGMVRARFLIPMAISLGYGILFTTFVILILNPAMYLIYHDIKKGFLRKEYQGGEDAR